MIRFFKNLCFGICAVLSSISVLTVLFFTLQIIIHVLNCVGVPINMDVYVMDDLLKIFE